MMMRDSRRRSPDGSKKEKRRDRERDKDKDRDRERDRDGRDPRDRKDSTNQRMIDTKTTTTTTRSAKTSSLRDDKGKGKYQAARSYSESADPQQATSYYDRTTGQAASYYSQQPFPTSHSRPPPSQQPQTQAAASSQPYSPYQQYPNAPFSSYPGKSRRSSRRYSSDGSYSGSTSSSLLDISRQYPEKQKLGKTLANFFTRPSSTRRLRRRRSGRKTRGVLFFSNSSSSSVNSDMAYGHGYIPKPRSRDDSPSYRNRSSGQDRNSRREGSQRNQNHPSGPSRTKTDEEIIALGRQLSDLAKSQNEDDLRRIGRAKPSQLVSAAAMYTAHRRSRHEGSAGRGLGSSRPTDVSSDEEDWESASEDDYSSDSGNSDMAYGSVIGHSFKPAVAAAAAGAAAGAAMSSRTSPRPRPTSSKTYPPPPGLQRRKSSVVDPQLFGPYNSLRGHVTSPCGFDGEPTTGPHRKEPSSSITSKQKQPLTRIEPVPLTDAATYRRDLPQHSRPAPVTLQQPKPVTPVSSKVYNAEALESPGRKDRSGKRSRHSAEHDWTDAAVAAGATAAVGAMVVADRKHRREPSYDDGGDPSRKDDAYYSRNSQRKKSQDRSSRHEEDAESPRKRREIEASHIPKMISYQRGGEDIHVEYDGDRYRQDSRPARQDAKPTASGALVKRSQAAGPDPFQYQVADDAFPTPLVEFGSRPLTPNVVTVAREPNFEAYSPPRTPPPDGRLSRKDSFDIEHMTRDPSSGKSTSRDPREGHLYEEEEHEATSIYDESRHSTMPVPAAAFAAAIAVEQSASKERDRQRRGREMTRSGSRVRSSSPRDMVQEEADRYYRESRIALKIAEDEQRSRSHSPEESVVQKYEEQPAEVYNIVSPPEMEDRSSQKGPYDGPDADVRIDNKIYPSDTHKFATTTRDLDTPVWKSRDPSCERERPLLNLVFPTPLTSRQPTPSTDHRNAPRAKSEEEPQPAVDDTPRAAEELVDETMQPVSKSVTWGKNETKQFEPESPEHQPRSDSSERSRPRLNKSSQWGILAAAISGSSREPVNEPSASTSPRDENVAERSPSDASPASREQPPIPGPKPASPKPDQMPGGFADDVEFTAALAAGLQDTGFDPNIVIDDPKYARRDSPPGTNELDDKGRYNKSTSDLGDYDAATGHWTFTTASKSAKEEPTGFKDGVPEPVEENSFESTTKLSKKDKKKLAKKQAAAQAAAGSLDSPKEENFETPPTESTPVETKSEEAFAVDAPSESTMTRKLSKKEKKKLEKEAKAKALADDDFVTSTISPTAEDHPVESSVPPEAGEDEWALPTTKKSKKKKNRKSGGDWNDEEPPTATVTDDWSQEPITTRENGHEAQEEREPRQDSGDYDAASARLEERTNGDSSRNADPEENWETTSNKSKKKSKRSSRNFDELPPAANPSEVSLPGSTKSSRSSKRRSRTEEDFDAQDDGTPTRGYDPFDDRDVTSVVSEGRHHERHRSRGSRSSSYYDDDARSVASAPGSNRKRKDSEKRSSGIFSGIFGKSNGTKDSEKKESFLDNADTLGAGVGLASAAVVAAALSRPNAPESSPETEQTTLQSLAAERLTGDVDPEIFERHIKPAIDPQYGDLLPLPPSEPGTPVSTPENLPDLPDSRPDTPIEERNLLRRELLTHRRRRSTQETPTKSPSQTAIPIALRLGQRGGASSSPSSLKSPPPSSPMTHTGIEASVTPRKPSRPTSWDSSREIKPLYLLEQSRQASQNAAVAEEAMEHPLPPSEPSEASFSEASAQEFVTPAESADGANLPLGHQTDPMPDYVSREAGGSQETTPKAEVKPVFPSQSFFDVTHDSHEKSIADQESDPEPPESTSKNRSSYLLTSTPSSSKTNRSSRSHDQTPSPDHTPSKEIKSALDLPDIREDLTSADEHFSDAVEGLTEDELFESWSDAGTKHTEQDHRELAPMVAGLGISGPVLAETPAKEAAEQLPSETTEPTQDLQGVAPEPLDEFAGLSAKEKKKLKKNRKKQGLTFDDSQETSQRTEVKTAEPDVPLKPEEPEASASQPPIEPEFSLPKKSKKSKKNKKSQSLWEDEPSVTSAVQDPATSTASEDVVAQTEPGEFEEQGKGTMPAPDHIPQGDLEPVQQDKDQSTPKAAAVTEESAPPLEESIQPAPSVEQEVVPGEVMSAVAEAVDDGFEQPAKIGKKKKGKKSKSLVSWDTDIVEPASVTSQPEAEAPVDRELARENSPPPILTTEPSQTSETDDAPIPDNQPEQAASEVTPLAAEVADSGFEQPAKKGKKKKGKKSMSSISWDTDVQEPASVASNAEADESVRDELAQDFPPQIETAESAVPSEKEEAAISNDEPEQATSQVTPLASDFADASFEQPTKKGKKKKGKKSMSTVAWDADITEPAAASDQMEVEGPTERTLGHGDDYSSTVPAVTEEPVQTPAQEGQTSLDPTSGQPSEITPTATESMDDGFEQAPKKGKKKKGKKSKSFTSWEDDVLDSVAVTSQPENLAEVTSALQDPPTVTDAASLEKHDSWDDIAQMTATRAPVSPEPDHAHDTPVQSEAFAEPVPVRESETSHNLPDSASSGDASPDDWSQMAPSKAQHDPVPDNEDAARTLPNDDDRAIETAVTEQDNFGVGDMEEATLPVDSNTAALQDAPVPSLPTEELVEEVSQDVATEPGEDFWSVRTSKNKSKKKKGKQDAKDEVKRDDGPSAMDDSYGQDGADGTTVDAHPDVTKDDAPITQSEGILAHTKSKDDPEQIVTSPAEPASDYAGPLDQETPAESAPLESIQESMTTTELGNDKSVPGLGTEPSELLFSQDVVPDSQHAALTSEPSAAGTELDLAKSIAEDRDDAAAEPAATLDKAEEATEPDWFTASTSKKSKKKKKNRAIFAESLGDPAAEDAPAQPTSEPVDVSSTVETALDDTAGPSADNVAAQQSSLDAEAEDEWATSTSSKKSKKAKKKAKAAAGILSPVQTVEDQPSTPDQEIALEGTAVPDNASNTGETTSQDRAATPDEWSVPSGKKGKKKKKKASSSWEDAPTVEATEETAPAMDAPASEKIMEEEATAQDLLEASSTAQEPVSTPGLDTADQIEIPSTVHPEPEFEVAQKGKKKKKKKSKMLSWEDDVETAPSTDVPGAEADLPVPGIPIAQAIGAEVEIATAERDDLDKLERSQPPSPDNPPTHDTGAETVDEHGQVVEKTDQSAHSGTISEGTEERKLSTDIELPPHAEVENEEAIQPALPDPAPEADSPDQIESLQRGKSKKKKKKSKGAFPWESLELDSSQPSSQPEPEDHGRIESVLNQFYTEESNSDPAARQGAVASVDSTSGEVKELHHKDQDKADALWAQVGDQPDELKVDTELEADDIPSAADAPTKETSIFENDSKGDEAGESQLTEGATSDLVLGDHDASATAREIRDESHPDAADTLHEDNVPRAEPIEDVTALGDASATTADICESDVHIEPNIKLTPADAPRNVETEDVQGGSNENAESSEPLDQVNPITQDADVIPDVDQEFEVPKKGKKSKKKKRQQQHLLVSDESSTHTAGDDSQAAADPSQSGNGDPAAEVLDPVETPLDTTWPLDHSHEDGGVVEVPNAHLDYENKDTNEGPEAPESSQTADQAEPSNSIDDFLFAPKLSKKDRKKKKKQAAMDEFISDNAGAAQEETAIPPEVPSDQSPQVEVGEKDAPHAQAEDEWSSATPKSAGKSKKGKKKKQKAEIWDTEPAKEPQEDFATVNPAESVIEETFAQPLGDDPNPEDQANLPVQLETKDVTLTGPSIEEANKDPTASQGFSASDPKESFQDSVDTRPEAEDQEVPGQRTEPPPEEGPVDEVVEKPSPESPEEEWALPMSKKDKKKKKKEKRLSQATDWAEAAPSLTEAASTVQDTSRDLFEISTVEQHPHEASSPNEGAAEPLPTASTEEPTLGENRGTNWPEQDDVEAIPQRKVSKKDKKKAKNLSFPIEEDKVISIPAKEEQPSTSSDTDHGAKITEDAEAEPQSTGEGPAIVPDDTFDDFSTAETTKKGKKQKKKGKVAAFAAMFESKEEASDVVDPITEQSEPPLQPEADPEAADLWAMPVKKKKGKKGRKNMIDDETTSTDAAPELPIPPQLDSAHLADVQDATRNVETPAAQDFSSTMSARNNVPQKEPAGEVTLDLANETEHLDSTHVGNPTTSQDMAENLDVDATLLDDSAVADLKPDVEPSEDLQEEQPAPAVDVDDEWSMPAKTKKKKKGKKDKSQSTSGTTTPQQHREVDSSAAEVEPKSQIEDQSAALQAEQEPKYGQQVSFTAEQPAPTEDVDVEWSLPAKKQKRKKGNKENSQPTSGTATPQENVAQEETAPMAESESIATEWPADDQPEKNPESVQPEEPQQDLPEQPSGEVVDVEDEWAIPVKKKKGKKDKKVKSLPPSDIATPVEMDEPVTVTASKAIDEAVSEDHELGSQSDSGQAVELQQHGVEPQFTESTNVEEEWALPTKRKKKTKKENKGSGSVSRSASPVQQKDGDDTSWEVAPELVPSSRSVSHEQQQSATMANVDDKWAPPSKKKKGKKAKSESTSGTATPAQQLAFDDSATSTKVDPEPVSLDEGMSQYMESEEAPTQSPSKLAESTGQHDTSDIPVVGAAAVTAGVLEAGLTRSKGSKKKAKGKKKIMDKRNSQGDDIFDDPSLWESAEKKSLHNDHLREEEDDGFWESAQSDSRQTHGVLVDEAQVEQDDDFGGLKLHTRLGGGDIEESPVLGRGDTSQAAPELQGLLRRETLSEEPASGLLAEEGSSQVAMVRAGPEEVEARRSPGRMLPVVPEVPEMQPEDAWGTDERTELQRDSGFIAESPASTRRNTRHVEHDEVRDSGVHSGVWDEAGVMHTPEPSTDKRRKLGESPQGTPVLRQPESSRATPEPEKLRRDKKSTYETLQKNSGPAVVAAAAAATAAQHRSVSDRVTQQQRSPSSPSQLSARRSASNTSLSLSRRRTPEPLNFRPESPGINIGSSPPLRRVDKRVSGDLRSLRQHDKNASTTSTTTTPAPTPTANEGRVRSKDMADVYDGYGEGRIGSPRSPTRPHSMRRRQSMQVLELESKVEQLIAENRSLTEARAHAEKNMSSGQRATSMLSDRDTEISALKQSIQFMQNEISRLTEVNEGLTSANAELATVHSGRYADLQAGNLESSRGLGPEGTTSADIDQSLQAKDAEIAELRAQLESSREQIRNMQRQILESKQGDADFLRIQDEDYFDNRCQQLCSHVQQWVLRFSKFSDMRACRLTSEIDDVKTIDRLDNTILDGSDVDAYLNDRVKRRDIFMSMTMNMIWEFVFTRYLFGMDREQRQKLKSLEKLLTEVGPPHAVRQWRAVTLTLLSRRDGFQQQRDQDTEAVVQAIFQTLCKILPPPSNLESQIQTQLRRVMREAVDLSIEMRTQKAEYMMLPPLQPEYDASGELTATVPFNASMMNERSGNASLTNEDLEASTTPVRVVLFPLVVKKGDDSGIGDEEIVVCPAQVLVKQERSRRHYTPSSDAGGGASLAAPSQISLAPTERTNYDM